MKIKSLMNVILVGATMVSGAAHAEITKAHMNLEDLKVLVGMSARLPSAEGTSNVTSNKSLQLNLSDSEKKLLVKKIQAVEIARAELSEKISTEVSQKKNELRKTRRALQNARLSNGNNDALSSALFESLLSEANVEAHAESDLAQFDAAHAIVLEVESGTNEARQVQSIAMGGQSVWNSSSSNVTAIAAK
jgi:small-conductance mechanosensitive channel